MAGGEGDAGFAAPAAPAVPAHQRFVVHRPTPVQIIRPAVRPDDDAVVRRVGEAVLPLWRQARPDNPLLDVLRLGSQLDGAIREHGEVLVPWGHPTPAARQEGSDGDAPGLSRRT